MQVVQFPHGQLNGNIFKMRNIWSFLIGQFLLSTCVVFFILKTSEKEKKYYLVKHAYCRTECCTNCHCPSTRSKTALLFPGLIAPLQRIHVQYTPLYFWVQSVRYKLYDVETLVNFCGNICFAKQLKRFTDVHDWLMLQWAFTIRTVPLLLSIST